MSREAPPPYMGDNQAWAEDLSNYLVRTGDKLAYTATGDSANQDGILLWDATGYPVVSKDGEFRQIVLADGRGLFARTSDLALSSGVTTAIPWSAQGALSGLSISGNTIVFEEDGYYLAAFSAQINSTNSSTVNFAFWSSVNGTAGNTMRCSLHSNVPSLVVSRSAIFNVSAGDALTAYAAVDSTGASLKAFAANSIATEPASPAATLSITRLHQ